MFDRIRRSMAPSFARSLLSRLRPARLASSVALAGLVALPQLAEAPRAQDRTARAEHAVAGEIRKVDHDAKTIVIHTTDGADETVKVTDRTAVRGLKDVRRATDATAKAGLEGTTVVVHYTGEGADKTAVRIDHIGKRALKTAKGTVVRVDDAGKFVVVKTAEGTEETFELSKDAVVDTGRGIKGSAVATGGAIKKGADVTVHYSDEGGKKLVHLVKSI